jgi:6-pyruvoyltetrahydropterin/6-carboxytetrahydropterin synthase
MVYIERRERFSAAHQLYNPNWSEEKNEEVFGKCANTNFHGHNFILYVTVKGEPNPDTGFVINLTDLSRIIKDKVIEQVDHKNLNLDVPFLKGKLTSTEIIVKEFWKILAPEIAEFGAELHKLRLVETENNAVEYYGE